MKRLILVSVVLLSFSWFASAQEEPIEKTTQVVKRDLKMNKYHNVHDLEPLNKNVLKGIYMKRIDILNELLPLLAVKAQEGDYIEDVNVPMDKKRIKAIKKYAHAKDKFVEGLTATMTAQLNYADSKDLIWGIIFLEGMIGHIFDYLEHEQTGDNLHGQ